MLRVLVPLLVTPGDLVAGFGTIHLPPAPPADPPAPPPTSVTSPPPPPASPASTAGPEYVENHNAWRALHEGTGNLVYDADLAADAQAFAETCPTGHNDPNQGDNGENLFWAANPSTGGAPDTPYSVAVNAWYDEIKDYTWPQTFGGQTSNGGVVRHFTQVVWKETTKVGCGKHTGCTNMFSAWFPGYINSAVVCRYSPRSGQPSSGYYNQVGACKNGMVDGASKHCKE